MKKLFILFLSLYAISCSEEDRAPSVDDFFSNIAPGETIRLDEGLYDLDMRSERHIIKGKAVKDDFELKISYLGASSWAEPRTVVYWLDAYWNYKDIKYIHYLSKRGIIPPVLIVGIGYSQGHDYFNTRPRDLLKEPQPFLDVITNEIIPYVESRFHCDPRKRILQGASLGGHFSLYAFLTNTLEKKETFSSYIAISPAIIDPPADIFGLEEKVSRKTTGIPSNLFVCFGDREDEYYFKGPIKTMIKTLLLRHYSGLNLLYHEYKGRDHFTVNRPGYVDGILLFLSKKGAGYEDISQDSFSFDFSARSEIYDWSPTHSPTDTAAKEVGFEETIDRDNGPSGSMKVRFDFSGKGKGAAGSLNFIFNEFHDFYDKEFRYSLHIPENLAGRGYRLRFFITSTERFIRDYSPPFPLNRSGWHEYQYQFQAPPPLLGDNRKVKEMGIEIQSAGAPWSGEILIDNIRW